jgi:predicted deacylase
MKMQPEWRSGWQLWQATPEAALHVFCKGNAEEGPTVLVAAGIHGDEYEGPASVAWLANELGDKVLRGRVVMVPVMNPLARLSGTRLTQEDGKNLARSFPGRPGGTVTERLAAAIFEHLVMPSSYVIDLHSGGVEYLFTPLAGFYGQIDPVNTSYVAARRFGLPSLWQLPPTAGVLSYEAARRDKVAIGHEYLGAGQLSETGVRAYADGTMNCLHDWGLLNQPTPCKTPEQRCFTGDWQLSRHTGLFVSHIATGSKVEKGALVAEVHNERGEILQTFEAPFAGEILGLRSKAHIQEGAWAVLLGMRHELA